MYHDKHWRVFVEHLIQYFSTTTKTSWGKNELVDFIKDEKTKWLEKILDTLDKE